MLFILGGTVFNIVITVLAFIVLLIIYNSVISFFPESNTAFALPVIFVASILVSFFVYRCVINILIKKIDMDKYFDPMFKRPVRKP